MSTIQVFKKLSTRSAMRAALVKSGLVEDKPILIKDEAGYFPPKYKWENAPKVERFVVNTTDKEKEILANVPQSTPKTKRFRRLLKIAALLSIKLEKISKALGAIKAQDIDTVVNSHHVIRLFKEQLNTEEALDKVLVSIGA